jgi:LacI family transcriptional regulator
VVGYDDVAFVGMAFVPLTSIRQPAHEIGLQPTELLFDETSGRQHRNEEVRFTAELVVRDVDALGQPARYLKRLT